MRNVGTTSRGIRCPIIRQGDDLAHIVVASVLEAAQSEGFQLNDRDVVALTESIVARAQGNYATVDALAKDVYNKLGGETVGVISPSSAVTVLPFVCGALPVAARRLCLCSATPPMRWVTSW